MRCRICDQTGTSRLIERDDRVCLTCSYIMQLTIVSLSEYWYDIVMKKRSDRMKAYYRRQKMIIQ